jgi:hypothetical protein
MLLVSESVFFEEARSAMKTNQAREHGHLPADIIHVMPTAGSGFGSSTAVRAS